MSGGLWGPALLLGSSLGERCWSEAATAMALASLAPGAPLRAMALSVAGKPALVLGGNTEGGSRSGGRPLGLMEMTAGVLGDVGGGSASGGPASASHAVLLQWAGNLAVLAGQRSMPGVQDAVIALGDMLRQEEAKVSRGSLLVAGSPTNVVASSLSSPPSRSWLLTCVTPWRAAARASSTRRSAKRAWLVPLAQAVRQRGGGTACWALTTSTALGPTPRSPPCNAPRCSSGR